MNQDFLFLAIYHKNPLNPTGHPGLMNVTVIELEKIFFDNTGKTLAVIKAQAQKGGK